MTQESDQNGGSSDRSASYASVDEEDVRDKPLADRRISPALAEYLSEGPRIERFGIAEAAELTGVSPETVHDQIKEGQIVGWRRRNGDLIIPAEQFDESGHVIEGISEVNKILGNPTETWDFLTSMHPFTDRVERPLDSLKAGRVQEVLSAAPGYGVTFT